jgi:cyclophilin family peptidyl-prolyl cis-trans isomerase
MPKMFILCLAGALTLTAAACSRPSATNTGNTGAAPQQSTPSSPPFFVKFETTKGDFVIEVNPDWSPNGAAHLRELVDKKFYDGCGFFRNIPDFMVQFGMNGDPKVQAEWGNQNIPDDPVKQSNRRGYVTYAKTGLPDSRSTQLFINIKDNSMLDTMGFAPIGTVLEGMDVVDSLYKTGENPPETQSMITQQGNEYLKKQYPELDYIKTARVVEKPAAKP